MEDEQVGGQLFNDTLDFNAWQLTPAFPEPYNKIIGKDAPLSNINNPRDMEHIDTNLRIATYLDGMTTKFFVGYQVYVKGSNEPIIIEETNPSKVIDLVNGEVVSMTKLYDERKLFHKSVHNKLARAYVRMALSRGINGQAAKDLKTVRSEEQKQLMDLTNRGGWNPFGKKSPTAWGNYEMQK